MYAVPQNAANDAKANVLYSMALQSSIVEMEKQWGNIGGAQNYGQAIVESNPEITDGFLTEFDGHQVEYLDTQALIDRYMKIGKEFPVLEIHPIHTDGSFLRIEISVSWFSYRKGQAFFAFSDWSDVEFAFDCASRTYVISSVKLGGI